MPRCRLPGSSRLTWASTSAAACYDLLRQEGLLPDQPEDRRGRTARRAQRPARTRLPSRFDGRLRTLLAEAAAPGLPAEGIVRRPAGTPWRISPSRRRQRGRRHEPGGADRRAVFVPIDGAMFFAFPWRSPGRRCVRVAEALGPRATLGIRLPPPQPRKHAAARLRTRHRSPAASRKKYPASQRQGPNRAARPPRVTLRADQQQSCPGGMASEASRRARSAPRVRVSASPAPNPISVIKCSSFPSPNRSDRGYQQPTPRSPVATSVGPPHGAPACGRS